MSITPKQKENILGQVKQKSSFKEAQGIANLILDVQEYGGDEEFEKEILDKAREVANSRDHRDIYGHAMNIGYTELADICAKECLENGDFNEKDDFMITIGNCISYGTSVEENKKLGEAFLESMSKMDLSDDQKEDLEGTKKNFKNAG